MSKVIPLSSAYQKRIRRLKNDLDRNLEDLRQDKTISLDDLPIQESYVKEFYHEQIRNLLTHALIYEWTGKSQAEQGDIISRTHKGMHWSRLLVKESQDNFLKVAMRMTTSDVTATLNDLRVLRNVADTFGDILYEEQHLRKRQDNVISK
jgi:hypothetical protein